VERSPDRGRHRLLDEQVLAALGGRERLRGVGELRRGDDDGVDVVARQELLGAPAEGDAVVGRQLRRPPRSVPAWDTPRPY
jgi:hypothetical protein